ncbi:14-3-3 protein [Phakopsora pachyrhizi]|nr:14-3-3 protein [Phakopsora pachyrhizi]
MVTFIKDIAKLGIKLSVEEFNLFSVDYKNIIGECHASWRAISSSEQNKDTKGNEVHIAKFMDYCSKVEKELAESYKQAREITQSDLAPTYPICLELALSFLEFY